MDQSALIVLRGKNNDAFGLTIQNLTEPFQGEKGNGFVVFQVIYRSGVDVIFID